MATQRPDTVYLWVAIGQLAVDVVNTHAPKGHLLVKVGVTQWSRGRKRVTEVARQYGFEADVRRFERRDAAASIERKVLRLGKPVKGIAGDGRTEFRFMSAADLSTALAIISPPAPARATQPPKDTKQMPDGYWAQRAAEARKRAREANPPRIKPSTPPPVPERLSGATITAWVVAIGFLIAVFGS